MAIDGERGRRAALLAAPVALAAALLGGCGSRPDYPPNLSFPSRTDRLVLKSPEAPPTAPGEPGKVVEELAALDSLGGKTLDPRSLSAGTRTALDRHLREMFGTPGAPSISGDPDAGAAAARLGVTPDELAEGSRLFRKQCLQCHNLTGDGRGTAAYSVPYPRDFRRGVFKFTSTAEIKPRRADIVRTVTEGLPGTVMPAFGLLPANERDLLARFVTFLAVRGQVEFETLAALAGNESLDVPAFATGRTKAVLADWEQAERAPPPAGLSPEQADGDVRSPEHYAAVRRGFALFTAKAENACITCHADFGRKPVLRYDVWGTVVKPADLTDNKPLKGGKRAEDVFARVRGGIPAVGMPAHPEYSARQVWDLVRFVQAAPYPDRLPEDVRAAVYPKGENP